MTSEKFFKGYYIYRVICVGAVLTFAIISMVKCHSHVLDVEFRGPEWDNLDRESRDRENREAAERCKDAERNNEIQDRRDIERAIDYDRDHGA